MITIESFKTQFFDRDVAKAIDQGRIKGLTRAGVIIQRQAKRLLSRKSGGPAGRDTRGKFTKAVRTSSKPGEPPRMRTGLLKKFLFYGYDASSDSVVIGPAAISGGTDAPHVLEFGGASKIVVKQRAALKIGDRARLRTGSGARTVTLVTAAQVERANQLRGEQAGKPRTIKIAPRPYMAPAFALVRDKIAPQFRNAVTGGG